MQPPCYNWLCRPGQKQGTAMSDEEAKKSKENVRNNNKQNKAKQAR